MRRYAITSLIALQLLATLASAELGEKGMDLRVEAALRQIRALIGSP